MANSPWLFGSLFLGGFECSTHIVPGGHRLDMMAATQHDLQAREDYELCKAAGIWGVREAARWPLIDRGGKLDLSTVRELARVGKEAGVTQTWDLMHYGYPDDLDPFSAEFVERFATYARAVAQVLRDESEGTLYFTPVNEISYNSFAAGDAAHMAPFAHGRGWELKKALVRASIAAINAIWEVDPEARILNVDPLIRLHAPLSRPDLKPEADYFNEHVVTQAFDMLAGLIEPELGGSRAHLGIVGFNYYAFNQWTIQTPEEPQRFLPWDDPQWVPISDLMLELQEKYGGPLVLAETGSSTDGRARWLNLLTVQAQQAIEKGVDLQGICMYPIVTSPDWEDPTSFFEGGLFDVVPQLDGRLKRVIVSPVAEALRQAQAVLDPEHVSQSPHPAEIDLPEKQTLYGLADLHKQARTKAGGFSYQTLLVGGSMVVEEYCFPPGSYLLSHKHETTEHVLTVISGTAHVQIGDDHLDLTVGQTLLIPAGIYHAVNSNSNEQCIIQQVSSPKPWDARFGEPHPTNVKRDT